MQYNDETAQVLGSTASSPKDSLSVITKQSRLSMSSMIAIFAGGNLASLVLRMVGGLLVARFTDPEVLGLYNGLGLIFSYAPFLLLGISNGLNRELPYYIGKGEYDKAKTLASSAQAWSLILSTVLAIAMLGLAIFSIFRSNWMLAVGWVVQAFNAYVILYGQFYLETTFRTRSDFAHLSLINVIQNTIGLLSAPLASIFGFFGLCARGMLTGLSYVVLLWHWRPFRVKPRWDWVNLKHLFKIGMPIFAVGQLLSWWGAFNPTLILFLTGVKALGIYQIAALTSTSIVTLTAAIAQVTYPRMTEAYGKGASLGDILLIPRKSIFVSIVLSIPAVIAGWLLLPLVVNLILPKYSAGIPAAQWTLPMLFVLSLQPVNNAFNVIKRQDLFAVVTILGIIVNGLSLFWLGRNGYSLEFFPQAYTLGKFTSLIGSYLILFYLLRNSRSINQSGNCLKGSV